MRHRRRRTATAVLRWSALVLPINRRQWVEAMRAEIDAIHDDSAALEFALGCFWTSIKERACRVEFVASAVSAGIPAVLLTLAALAANLSDRHEGVETHVGAVFGILFAIFTLGAGLFLMKGAFALARYANILVPIYLALLLFLHAQDMETDGLPSVLYRALAIEGLAIWSILLLLCLFITRVRARANSSSRGMS